MSYNSVSVINKKKRHACSLENTPYSMGNLNGRLSLVKMYDHFRKIGNKVIHFVVAHGYGAYNSIFF